MASVFRLPLTLPNESFRLQFPFVFRRLQSLQMLLPVHLCPPLSLPTFSRPSIPRLFAASFPLSDPRCFDFLSSASVFGSDYSASVLPFLLFPVLPHSCFPSARLRSRFIGLPFLSSLFSHAFLPGSCTWLRCSFPFAPPCFAPTAVPQVPAFHSHFRPFPLPTPFLSSVPLPLPATQLSVSSFPLSSRFPLTAGLLRCCPSAFQLPGSSTSVPPGFPCFPSISSYSALCSFPFIPPGFAPTAAFPVLPFCSRFRASPHFRFLSSASARLRLLSLPLFPFPSSRSPLTAVPPVLLSSSVRPVSMPSLRFRYSASCTSFPPRCLASQWLPQRLRLLPLGSRLHPLSSRLRFWLLGLELYPLRYLSVASFSVLSQRTWLDYHTFLYLSTTFFKKFNFFLIIFY